MSGRSGGEIGKGGENIRFQKSVQFLKFQSSPWMKCE